jgi:dolichol kinase
MIQHKWARFAFYLFLFLMVLVNSFSLFSGLMHPEMFDTLEPFSRWSIKGSQARWLAYHVWFLIVMFLLVWAELKSKRGLFLLLMFISMLLLYYPLLTS